MFYVQWTNHVICAVTVITWVTLELKPIVVHKQKVIAGDITPIVRLEFLVQSVATHGQCISLVLIVTNFHQEGWLAKLGWRLVGMIILYNICDWVPRCTHTYGTVVPKG